MNDRPGSLNLNIRGMGQSATISIKNRCRALRREGREVYDFGLGQSPFPVPNDVVEALRSAAAQKDYLPSEGLPELREAVADFHRRKDQISANPDLVLIGPGSKELMFLLQLVFYGEIMLGAPCWVSYLPQAHIIGRKVTMVPTTFESGWKITPEKLMWFLVSAQDDDRPRLLIINYPMNPTGQTYSAEELRDLADVARRYNLIVLSDEIYGQLHFGDRHVSIARYYPERTIITSGLSKWCGAGGWRLGTCTFPRELSWLMKAMAAVASETYTSVCAPIQYAAVAAFRGSRGIEEYLQHVRRVLRALAERSVQALQSSGARIHEPAGAFYLYPDWTPIADRFRRRGINRSADLCEDLLAATGVALLPGEAFGQPPGELTARLSYVDFDGAAALAASESVPLDQPLPESVVTRCGGNVCTGVARLAEWIAQPE